MGKKIFKRLCITYIPYIFILLLTAGVVHATPYDARIWIQPPSTTVPTGSSFSLDIATEILAMDLYSAAIGLSYDPAILAFTGATEGPFLRENGEGGICNNLNPCSTGFDVYPNISPGYLEIYNYLIASVVGVPPVRNGVLATLNFNAIRSGTSPVAFDWVEFIDSSPDMLDVQNTGGNVNAVPEPATLLLLGAGMIPLMAIRVRKWIQD